jgi:UPF0042 nucleotide-binding protein
MQVVVVTGMSGAGKSTVLNALEDLDYYCVDNLPLPLVPTFLELFEASKEREKVGLGIDVRSGEFLTDAQRIVPELSKGGHKVDVLFLEAPDDVLVRRFSQTRRKHPLGGDLRGAEHRERERVAELRELAVKVIDTGSLNVHELKEIVKDRYGRQGQALTLTIESFGFKYGMPADADIVLDARFLPNPYFVESLSGFSGLDAEVSRFVLGSSDAQEFLGHVERLLEFTLPRFEREGKAYVTLAIGCTGGRHRSVALARELAHRIEKRVSCAVRHRDVERGTT